MQQTQEIWKTLPVNKNYEISNKGNIRHRDRPNQYLKPMPYDKKQVKLSKDGVVTFYNIAKLVSLTFIGKVPSTGEYIKHIDGDNYNNSLENLEIHKGYPNSKRIRCLNDGKIFNRALEAAEYYHISNKSKVSNVCLHRTKACQGYVFEYVD